MAKHASDDKTQALLDDIEDTCYAVASVVNALGDRSVTRNEIAEAARWNAGYLSQVLGGAKKPTAAKMVPLIRALVIFCREKGAPHDAGEALARVAGRYGVALEPLANPASGPIAPTADNHLLCDDVRQAVASRLRSPGCYAIDGPAMSGVSTALSYVGRLLRDRGATVVRIDAEKDLGGARVEKAKARMLGGVAAAIVGRPEPLEQEYYEVQSAIKDHLIAAAPDFGVLIDNVNQLSDDQQHVLGQVLRDWRYRRADGEAGFVTTTVWLGYTWTFETIQDVALHSHMALDYVFLHPFAEPEICTLAEALEPFGRASGKVRDQGWAQDAASAAHYYFGGQPHLTHLYLWDRMEDGTSRNDKILSLDEDDRPRGAYEVHLKKVARAAIGLVDPDFCSDTTRVDESPAAKGLADTLRSEDPVARRHRAELEALGVVDIRGHCSNRYYAKHLPDAIERSLVIEPAAVPSTTE